MRTTSVPSFSRPAQYKATPVSKASPPFGAGWGQRAIGVVGLFAALGLGPQVLKAQTFCNPETELQNQVCLMDRDGGNGQLQTLENNFNFKATDVDDLAVVQVDNHSGTIHLGKGNDAARVTIANGSDVSITTEYDSRNNIGDELTIRAQSGSKITTHSQGESPKKVMATASDGSTVIVEGNLRDDRLAIVLEDEQSRGTFSGSHEGNDMLTSHIVINDGTDGEPVEAYFTEGGVITSAISGAGPNDRLYYTGGRNYIGLRMEGENIFIGQNGLDLLPTRNVGWEIFTFPTTQVFLEFDDPWNIIDTEVSGFTTGTLDKIAFDFNGNLAILRNGQGGIVTFKPENKLENAPLTQEQANTAIRLVTRILQAKVDNDGGQISPQVAADRLASYTKTIQGLVQ